MKVAYYDWRKEKAKEGFFNELGKIKVWKLTAERSFEAYTDLGYSITIVFDKEDIAQLRGRLNELHQKNEEREAKKHEH